jgi:hypothetical protein
MRRSNVTHRDVGFVLGDVEHLVAPDQIDVELGVDRFELGQRRDQRNPSTSDVLAAVRVPTEAR